MEIDVVGTFTAITIVAMGVGVGTVGTLVGLLLKTLFMVPAIVVRLAIFHGTALTVIAPQCALLTL